jgi:hypothetical protein
LIFFDFTKERLRKFSQLQERYRQNQATTVEEKSDIFLKHFEEDPDALSANQKVDASLMKIWRDIVINPLKETVSFEAE